MIQRTFTYNYDNKNIDYSVWFTSDSESVDTVIFLGTVQIDKIPEWVAEACPPRTAIVQGSPHWHAKEDGSDLPEYMFGFSESALRSIGTRYHFDSLNVIAESQAVPTVIRLFVLDEFSSRLTRAVFLQPLGFNADIFAGSDQKRMAELKKRVAKNASHQLSSLLLDSRLRYNHRLLSKTVSFGDPKSKAQYSSGLKYNSLPELNQLLQRGKKVTIICGAKDKIFPAEEIRQHLAATGIELPVLEVKGAPHSPLATKLGMNLLKAALSELDSQ
jgi:pimeloyl-ACP methyl ester carboxylesterase